MIIGLRIAVSGLNHLLGRLKRSDLIQSGRDTSSDVVGGLTQPRSEQLRIIPPLWGIRKHPFGPLEASGGLWEPRGQTKQAMVGTEVEYGILEQVRSIQQAQK